MYVLLILSGNVRVIEIGWWSESVIGSIVADFKLGRSCCVRKR